MSAHNEVIITGSLQTCSVVRHSPAGVPIVEFTLAHESNQIEAEHPRKVACTLNCIAVGQESYVLQALPLGVLLKASGFLAQKNARASSYRLHLLELEILDQNADTSA